MVRALLLVCFLLIGVAALAPAASAETVSVGRCEIDACVVVCVDVTQPCHDGKLACTVFAFRWLCTPV